MFFCWSDEIQKTMIPLSEYMQDYPDNFVIAPLIKAQEKSRYAQALTQLSNNSVAEVSPVYIKASNNNVTTFLNPQILIHDFSAISKLISQSKPDIIVCYYVLHALPLVFFKRFFGYSLCVVAMGSDINVDNNLTQRFIKKLTYPHCDLVFAVSNSIKQKIAQDYNGPIVIQPAGANTSFFRNLDAKEALRRKWNVGFSTVVLTVCRLDKNKAVDIVIKALHKLHSNDVGLLVVGAGPELQNLLELVSSLCMNHNVLFLGSRNANELLEIYNLSDFFTLSSYSEGMPRVVVEAMSCGCVPIVTDVGDLRSVVSENGYIVPPGDIDGFVSAFQKAFSLSLIEKQGLQQKSRDVAAAFNSQRLFARMLSELQNYK